MSKHSGQEVKEYLEKTSDGIIWDGFGIEDSEWELKDVPLSSIPEKPGETDDIRTAEKYAKLRTPFPPVVLVGDKNDYDILDGHHRITAARIRKDKTIKAYVPV